MHAKTKLGFCVGLLVLLGFGMAVYKNQKLGVPFLRGERVQDWQIEAKVTFFATGKQVNVRMALPDVAEAGRAGGSASIGYQSYEELSDNESTAVWTSSEREGPQSLYYWVRVREGASRGVEPLAAPAQKPQQHELSGTAGVAAETVVARALAASSGPDSLFVALFSELIEAKSSQEMMMLKRQYEQEHRDDALVMLGIDLLRMAGVPARVCHAVKMQHDLGVQSPYLLIEYHDGVYWKIRDAMQPTVVPNPKNWYVWNRGGGPLLEVSGGENSSVSFSVSPERVSLSSLTQLADSPLLVSTILGLPQSERAVFRYLVLIPIGAFVVVLLRNIVGIPTLGTFMPVLIALALLEIPLVRGLLMFTILVALGLWFRFLLSRLNLLVVPRVAACVVIVTLLMMLMSVVSHRLGFQGVVDITLFPMIILAWTIERMSIIWEEEGRHNAIVQVGGSLVVAVFAFLCMKIDQIQYWAFYFPELLLVLLAGILLTGRYTGYRLSELIRFKNFESA